MARSVKEAIRDICRIQPPQPVFDTCLNGLIAAEASILSKLRARKAPTLTKRAWGTRKNQTPERGPLAGVCDATASPSTPSQKTVKCATRHPAKSSSALRVRHPPKRHKSLKIRRPSRLV